jgi:hypothetical protein
LIKDVGGVEGGAHGHTCLGVHRVASEYAVLVVPICVSVCVRENIYILVPQTVALVERERERERATYCM